MRLAIAIGRIGNLVFRVQYFERLPLKHRKTRVTRQPAQRTVIPCFYFGNCLVAEHLLKIEMVGVRLAGCSIFDHVTRFVRTGRGGVGISCKRRDSDKGTCQKM